MNSMDRTGPRRRRRIAAPVVLIAGLALFLALPALLSRTLAHRILTTRAGRILAPGSLEVSAVRVSWFGPTEIEGAVLRDERGRRLIAANRAVFRWNLWQILFDRPGTATLQLPGAELDIERRADGRIDLYEALRPIIREHPEHRLVVEIERGRLRFRDPALVEPILADEAEVRLDIRRDPEPVEWELVLGRHAGGGKDPGRIVFKGRVHRPGDGGATISLEVSRWPWAAAIGGIVARGELDARLGAERREARWVLSGDATATDLIAARSGAQPGGDPLRLGDVRAAWDIEGQDGIWETRRLALATSLGASPGGGPDKPSAAPSADDPRGRPVTLDLDARFMARDARLEIGRLTLAVPYARLVGAGTIEAMSESSRVELKGTVSPDWGAIRAALQRAVEPNARIAGRPREWRLAGTFGREGADDRPSGLIGELGVQVDALDLYGLRLGGTSIVLRTDGGRLRFDPIDARLNEGTLHLEPAIVHPSDGPLRLKLGAASTLEDAVVNDEVSHRVLSYVAPVLDGATRVHGRVSVRGLDAEFPLSDPTAATTRVEGEVLFDEVRFLPGPLAESIIDLLPGPRGAEAGEGPMLVLRDPISFRIADRKVYQHGLNVPLGRIGSVSLEGSVDFEKRLDLLARFRVNPPRADRPVLAALLNHARFELPIRGTLAEPRIDQEGLKERLESLGSDMLGNSVVAGVEGLRRLLESLPRRREARKPPADAPEMARPEAPPPPRPSAEERKPRREQRRLERMEKKARRRMSRGRPPE